ncbi:MAG: SUMF1/EgtB/PvdO family nonheme iron enzyme [Anaerolineae bacterium]|nr:SUMF1/EgtB/PvdO family nonheme iron enzyme [Anaerolineae bacterium]
MEARTLLQPSLINYLDLSIQIGELIGERTYRLSIAGEEGIGRAEGEFHMPRSEMEVGRLLGHIEGRIGLTGGGALRGSSEYRQLTTFGQELFQNLLATPAVRDCYERAKNVIYKENNGLLLRLTTPPDDVLLRTTPWEFLHDGRRFLSVSNRTPIVRYIEPPWAMFTPLRLDLPLRILVVIASPKDQEPLNVEQEKCNISTALQNNPDVEIEVLEHATCSKLQKRLSRARAEHKPFHILHFIGHGKHQQEQSYLLFERPDGWSDLVDGEAMYTLLQDYRTVRVAVLNTCLAAAGAESRARPFANVATSLVTAGIPAVVAMQFPISDQAAITFSEHFYYNLGMGYSVITAVAEARKAIYTNLRDAIEFGTPVLFSRVREGVIFSVSSQARQLEALYLQAQNALTQKEYQRAINILDELLNIAPDYRNAAELKTIAEKAWRRIFETRPSPEPVRPGPAEPTKPPTVSVLPDTLVGTKLDKYEIVDKLGAGGMATVYKGYQESLNRYVAIKVLDPVRAAEKGFLARFTREAQTVANLDHPHILPIYDFGQDRGYTFLVMKFIPTGTLRDRLDREKVLPLGQAAKIVSQVASALDYAHQRGVVHRDIKPSNILLDEEGNVLLSDFGLAKILESTTRLTASGASLGTPAYISPEQALGEEVDSRTDVYSLGVVLYEMLTGQTPFPGDALSVALKHVQESPPPPRAINPELPEAVEQVILQALAKNPDERFTTAGALAHALKQAIAARSIITPPPPPPEPEPAAEEEETLPPGPALRIPRQVIAIAVGGMILLLAAIVAGLILLKGGGPTPTPAIPAADLTTTAIALLPPTPTSTPTATSTATTEPTTPPTATDTATPSPTPTSTPTSTATPTASATPTSAATPTKEPTSPPSEPPAGTIKVFGGVEMVYVPSGTFIMGSEAGDADERPVHNVWLSGFWIDRYEVTNAQYRKCEEAGICKRPAYIESNKRSNYYISSEYDDYPVIFVSSDDAATYCQWIGKRLPTEAEWEKAASWDWRTGTKLTWPWGNTFDDSKVRDGQAKDTMPVGSHPQGVSPYGAMDMAGNVLEWTADWYDKDYYQVSPSSNPKGPATGYGRVVRGGTWWDVEYDLRTTRRKQEAANARQMYLGFRCARDYNP